MPKGNTVEVDGIVIEPLPSARFKIKLADPRYPIEHIITGYISGKMRLHYIKILPGDRVRIELDPSGNMEIGRIVFRYK